MSTENVTGSRYHEIVLEENPDVGLVLDVAHAYAVSSDEPGDIIEEFRDRITEVHLSSRVGVEDHQPFKDSTPEFLESIEEVKRIGCPILLETSTSFEGTREEIMEEIQEVRAWLESRN